ncbi:MAG: transposase [Mangrovibacterium sp.]
MKYPIVIRSWHSNWDELSLYFDYDEHIRKIICATDTVEGFHRQVHKVTKTKGAFPGDMALLKLILTIENISKEQTQPVQN